MAKNFNKDFKSKQTVTKEVSATNEKLLSEQDVTSTVSDSQLARQVTNPEPSSLIKSILDSLTDSNLDVGKESATISANVNNLYSLEGYTGTPFVGERISADTSDNTGNNLLPVNILTAMVNVDNVKGNASDMMKEAITLEHTVKFKPAAWLVPYAHNVFGISSLIKDDSLLTNKYIFQVTDLMIRAQAAALTDASVFEWDDITMTVNEDDSKEVMALVYLTMLDSRLGDALMNLVITLSNFSEMVLSVSQFSREAKLYADDLLSEWNRSAVQAKISLFLDTVSLFAYSDVYSKDIFNAFTAAYKERTGRISPIYKTFQLVPVITDSKNTQFATLSYTKENQTVDVLTSDEQADVFKLINTIMLQLHNVAYRTPVMGITDKYGDWLLDPSTNHPDGIQTYDAIIKNLLTLRNKLNHWAKQLSAYYKFRTVLVNSGLMGNLNLINPLDLKDIKYSNKHVSKFLMNLTNTVGTSFEFGIRMSTALDLLTVDDFIGSGNLASLFDERELEPTVPGGKTFRLLHARIIEPPRAASGSTSWYGAYDIDLLGHAQGDLILPDLKVHAFEPVFSQSNKYGKIHNKNVPINQAATTSTVLLDTLPMYFYNRSGSAFRGVMKSSYFYGAFSILLPSMTQVLLNYITDIMPGGTDAMPTVKTQ